jgi:hypothetical protein
MGSGEQLETFKGEKVSAARLAVGSEECGMGGLRGQEPTCSA